MNEFYARLSEFRKKSHEPGSFFTLYAPVYLKLMSARSSIPEESFSLEAPAEAEELFHYLWLLNAKARYHCFVKQDYKEALRLTHEAIDLLPELMQKNFKEEALEKKSILFILTQNLARLAYYQKDFKTAESMLSEFKKLIFHGEKVTGAHFPEVLVKLLNSEGVELVNQMKSSDLDYYRQKVTSLEEKIERRHDKSLLDSFKRHVLLKPDATAFTDYDLKKNYSWKDLDLISNGIALKLPLTENIFVCTKQSILHPASLIACWKKGINPLMLHENYTDHELSLLEIKNIPALIDQEKLSSKFKTTILIDETIKADGFPATPSTLALGLFTSGSTGAPKLCRFSHESLISAAEIELFNEPVYKNDSGAILNLRPHFTSAGLNTLWPAILRGSKTIFSDKIRRTPMARFLNELLEKEKVNLLVLSPTFIISTFSNDDSGLKSPYKLPLYFGGSSLPWLMLTQLMDNHFLPAMRYGMTEVAHILSKKTYDKNINYNKADVGVPFKNFELSLNQGYVEIKSPGVFTQDGVYLTADKAEFNADGSLIMEGRDNRSININGFRFNTQQVEEVLSKVDGVRDVRVAEIGQKLYAFILGKAELENQLRTLSASELSPFKRPAHYLFLEEWPAGLNGKIDFSELVKKIS